MANTSEGEKYLTILFDLAAICDHTGPARLLDMVEGRWKEMFKTWLSGRPRAWRDGIEVVALDGFTGFKTATTEELPDAVAVTDPFHVVRLAGDAWTGAGVGSSRSCTAAAAAPTTLSIGFREPCTPAPICPPTSRRPGSNPEPIADRDRRPVLDAPKQPPMDLAQMLGQQRSRPERRSAVVREGIIKAVANFENDVIITSTGSITTANAYP